MKKKETKQFVQEDDEEDEESDDHRFASFGFCTVNKGNKLQLQNILLVDPAGLTMDRRWLSKPMTRDMDPAIMYPVPLSYQAT